jgi:hypothetical protein
MYRNLRPLSLCVAITSSFTIPAYAATTILPGETFENTDYFINTDQLNNQGHLINFGLIDNWGDFPVGAEFNNWAVTDNSGRFYFQQNSYLNNYGQFNNDTSGLVELNSGAKVLNTGVFNNSGYVNSYDWYGYPKSEFINTNTLNNSGNINNININNSGDINNQGMIRSESIQNNVTGVINNLVAGSIDIINNFINYGLINNEGNLTLNGDALLQNSGTVNNKGYILGLSNTAEINNSGIFNNDGVIDAGDSLIINNSGTFYNLMIDGSYSGIYGYGTGLEINNSGRFVNHNVIDGRNVTVNNSGDFENSSRMTMRVLNNLEGGVFNNQRDLLLNSSGYPQVMPEMNNAGEFNNYGMLSIATDGEFVLNNAGTFNQYGYIDKRYGSFTLNNAGVFNNGSEFSYTPELSLGSESSVDNSGVFNNWSGINVASLNNMGTYNSDSFVSNYITRITNSGIMNLHGVLTTAVFSNEINGVVNNDSNGSWHSNMTINQGFRNEGTINNTGQINLKNIGSNVPLVNNGIINNGVDMGNGYYGGNPVFNIDGDFSNTGTINNSMFARLSMSTWNLTTNSGLMKNDGDMEILYGYFDNKGAIENTGTLNINAWQVVNTGTINNNVDMYSYNNPVINIGSEMTNIGTINNASRANINIFGSLYNSGTISNDGHIDINSPALINSGIITGAGEFRGNLVITEAGTLAPGSLDMMMQGRGMTIYGSLDLNGTFAINSSSDFFPWFVPPGLTEVYGFVTLGENSVLDISFLDTSYFALGQTFDLMSAIDISGSFGSFTYDALSANNLALQWEILEGYGLGDLLRVSVVSAVPVPAAVWLFLSGLAGLIVVSRRREQTLH